MNDSGKTPEDNSSEPPPRPPRTSQSNTDRSHQRAARNNARAAEGSGRGAPRAPGNNDRSERPTREGGFPPRSERPARDGDRPARSFDRPRPDRAGSERSSDRTSDRGADRARPDRTSTDRGGRPDRGARPGTGEKGTGEKRLWTQAGAPARGNRDAREVEPEEDRDPFNTRMVRTRHDDPIIPEDVTPDELDRVARNELKTLSKDNAEGVANHLVMAARLISSDPAEAHQHAISAARRAGRIGVVRETLAITAYATGDYALALRELRTYRRITGLNTQLPLMVDSERALGRADKALELGRSVAKHTLPVAVQVELAIAMSGARLDLGQADRALTELTIPQLDPTVAHDWSPDLFAAYAAVHEELGHAVEAEAWYTYADKAQDALDQHNNPDETIEIIEDMSEEDFRIEVADAGNATGREATDAAAEQGDEPISGGSDDAR